MEYNDIIIIILLVVLIMTILFKYDVLGTSKNTSNLSNVISSNIQMQQDNQYKQVNKKENFNLNQRNNSYDSENYQLNKQIYNNNLNNSEKLNSSKMKKKIYKNQINDDFVDDNNTANSLDDTNTNTDIHNNYKNIKDKVKIKTKSILKKDFNKHSANDMIESIYNKKNIKSNNKKVVIDDYSETENIKSLNSMDNTLSDVMSNIE